MKKVFRLAAEAEFVADDIDDALEKLAAHFSAMAKGVDPPGLFTKGSIDIRLRTDPPYTGRVLQVTERYNPEDKS